MTIINPATRRSTPVANDPIAIKIVSPMLSKNGIVIIMTVQASNADAGSLLAIERNLGLSCC